MLVIEGVIKIESHGSSLVLKTLSGIDIVFEKDEGPNYIDIHSYLSNNEQDLITTVVVKWR